MSPRIPEEMPEGFPLIPAAKYKAKLVSIDDRIISAGEGGAASSWDGKKACWWRFTLLDSVNKGQSVSESTIIPFNADDTPVDASLLSKCWRWRDLCKVVYGGEFPKGVEWNEFKEKVKDTEWMIEVAVRKFRGVDRSEVVAVMSPEDEAPF